MGIGGTGPAFKSATETALISQWQHVERGQRILVRAPFVALIFPVLLAACATAIENQWTIFADPGKYEWFSCEQLLPERKRLEDKEKELKLLMEKAKQSTGGSAISVVAYQGEYVNAREELQVINATARAKKCKMPDDWQSSSAIR